jgi:hypothetical protein
MNTELTSPLCVKTFSYVTHVIKGITIHKSLISNTTKKMYIDVQLFNKRRKNPVA